ncbi:uncharacterized protein PFL1_03715 [Pseudozyma flocculosa PF-1]|uniref:protein O-GlcNAc transferase n=1 Tax=Pseudozyma flocculosa PF-1 TaxID=1277687 RepID=A0A061H8W3_9BASI|nr:uncharacterized protein PFL1_03715 [Pseudozyma flocculosa PF-1]EPQ28914.1 hypothetical protein PFL1_03715 [Pseudozyma flocculosa PF-1]
MLRAASAMAAQASSGAEGLQAVSSALLSQAKAQVIAGGITDAANTDQHPISAVAAGLAPEIAGQATQMARNLSDSTQYSAALSARIATALHSQTDAPGSLWAHGSPALTAMQATTGAAEVQMGQIAARAAVKEAESQLRAQAILRTAVSSAPQISGSLAQRRGSHGPLAATQARGPSSGPTAAVAASAPSTYPTASAAAASVSAFDYLRHLGLGHIAIPSAGLEQAWGRSPAASGEGGSRIWDSTNPTMGFSLSGVPSMPLMPTPPLQMLPPPVSPSFRKRRTRGKYWLPHHSRLASHSLDDESAGGDGGIDESQPNMMSAVPYPFQVVQTPGGTARPGWWVPPSEVSSEQQRRVKKSARRDSSTPDRSEDPQQSLERVPKTIDEEDEDQLPFFQPTFRDFTSDEYAALASAAAYATAALTSASSATGKPHEPGSGPRWRSLEASEQEMIAAQLRAWAGLEGPEKQAEAREELEKRQIQLISEARQAPSPLPGASAAGGLEQPSSASSFFPPDFASHYRTQLQALAEGYYARLHSEGLREGQWADPSQADGPPSSGALSSLNVKAPREPETVLIDRHSSHGSLAMEGIVPQAALPGSAQPNEPPIATPTLGPGAQDPVKLLTAASNAAGTEVTAPEVRDQLLQYAHSLYSTGNRDAPPDARGTDRLHPSLLPLLHTLHKLHPRHLPTLLLLSCAYYAAENHAGSLWYNNQILRIDPNYVESMSNIGTTLRALGRWKEAETWWWRAIKLRPGYWDAYENLLGVMCSPVSQTKSEGLEVPSGETASAAPERGSQAVEVIEPRFAAALKLCEYVESYIVPRRSTPATGLPQHAPSHLPLTQIPRLQNLYYAKGNLKYVLPEWGPVPAATEYQKSIEIVLSPSEHDLYSLRDLVVATCVVGVLSMGAMLPGSAAAAAAVQVATAIGIDPANPDQAALVSTGMYAALRPGGGILALVRDSGDRIVQTLLQLGGGQLPMVMVLPEVARRFCDVLFAETGGVLPSMAPRGAAGATQETPAVQQARKQAAQTSSTILLTLAKLFQDSTSNPVPGPHGPLTLGGIPPSVSLLLPLYYLSISMHPSASTCNNLGILLSTIPVVTMVVNPAGQHQQLNGQALAMQFYTHGLQLDPRHPHIYTNLGSLLKDLGHLHEAIKMYEKAVECNPTFDVALANLGNAIKDQGRTQDSIVYYRRAVEVNPHFPEALCGLVNALLAVCDWREVYSDDPARPGWMDSVSKLVTKQLREGCQYGGGALQSEGQLGDWVSAVVTALADRREAAASMWAAKLGQFYQPFDRMESLVCEGGFVIRLMERLMRRVQRKWYLDAYGPLASSSEAQLRVQTTPAERQRYAKLKLPACLVAPAVPTVLPFHTFTYPLSARQIRLICHRNALRISQGTLTQMWLPDHVYPPPSPPAPKINVGYISSDFNNHPLAHLMQSVFGFHDLERFNVFLYATTASDSSPYRAKIEREAQHFVDVSSWSHQQIVERVIADNIHVLMNLNGYTKGARNEVFAARPCPVQMQFMGFAGSMAAGWTDWVVADPVVCPPETTAVERWRQARATGQLAQRARLTDLGADLDPEEPSEDWLYMDRFLYMPHSYFVNDHAQGFREPATRQGADGGIVHPHQMSDEEAWAEEEQKRYAMRKQLFPDLPDDYIVFADFNQLYKCDPMLFRLWLRILQRVPKSILWLLRFPASGEPHLLQEARKHAGDEVAARVIFTDVAPKHIHIHRGRIADLFLDTTECNAHTTAADILWSGTPVLTWPRHLHKMCSRVAASIVRATGFGPQMEVDSERAYEDRAVALAESLRYTADPPAGAVSRRGSGELSDLRRALFLTRDTSPLFDTRRWVRDLERGYEEAWRRWVAGTDVEDSAEWEALPDDAPEKRSGHIWISQL